MNKKILAFVIFAFLILLATPVFAFKSATAVGYATITIAPTPYLLYEVSTPINALTTAEGKYLPPGPQAALDGTSLILVLINIGAASGLYMIYRHDLL